jgi:hypothetical protein
MNYGHSRIKCVGIEHVSVLNTDTISTLIITLNYVISQMFSGVDVSVLCPVSVLHKFLYTSSGRKVA